MFILRKSLMFLETTEASQADTASLFCNCSSPFSFPNHSSPHLFPLHFFSSCCQNSQNSQSSRGSQCSPAACSSYATHCNSPTAFFSEAGSLHSLHSLHSLYPPCRILHKHNQCFPCHSHHEPM